MPPDHLTAGPYQLASLVETVLAGTPTTTAAHQAGIDPADLDTAVQTYRTAGLTALQHHQENAWFHARIQPAAWNSAETVFRTRIGPRLDQLHHGQTQWWFLRKHPHWRTRVHTTDHQTVRALLDDLTTTGVIARWKPGVYEPETGAFGGDTAMTIVHDLFCADSRGVLNYTATDPPPMGRRELSLLLIRALQDHAGLDWFEAADVFDQVAQMRPTPPNADTTRLDQLAAQMRPLLALPANARNALFTPKGPLADATNWLAAFTTAGRQLAEAAEHGRLRRGIRAILAQIVIFHWNRLNLPAHTQAILTRAATTAILPRS